MDANAVGREYPDGFGYKRLGFLQGQSIGTAGDTVVSSCNEYRMKFWGILHAVLGVYRRFYPSLVRCL